MTGKDFSTEKEIWKAVPGFEGYEVSNQGRVQSFIYQKKHGPGRGQETIIMPEPQRMLKPNILSSGYYQTTLRKNNKPYYFKIHKLVLTVFKEPRPLGLQACHNDGIRSHNNIENLRWDTCKNNHTDRREHGTDPVGERHPQAKLSEIQIREIRNLVNKGFKHKVIAEIYGINRHYVSQINSRKVWGHVL